MKNTVLTVIFALLSTIGAFYAFSHPHWFQQRYYRGGHNVLQSFGIFAFRSSDALNTPFYASKTYLKYSTFCSSDRSPTPNYMLGSGNDFRDALCGNIMRSIQVIMGMGSALSFIGLVSSIYAVYRPLAGFPEIILSACTLVASLLLSIALLLFSYLVQQQLYSINLIRLTYATCKADSTDWSCWFYGYSFWACFIAVILLTVTGYLSVEGRAEKILYFRAAYAREMAAAEQNNKNGTRRTPSATFDALSGMRHFSCDEKSHLKGKETSALHNIPSVPIVIL